MLTFSVDARNETDPAALGCRQLCEAVLMLAVRDVQARNGDCLDALDFLLDVGADADALTRLVMDGDSALPSVVGSDKDKLN